MENKSPGNIREIIKRFLLIFIPLAIITGAVASFAYYVDKRSAKALLEIQERNNADFKAKIITENFDFIVSDLMYLSRMNELREMPERWDLPESLIANWRRVLAKELLLFSANMELYEQIRFLDEKGTEVVRVNKNNKVYVVPDRQLQYKGRRYYFKEAFSLKREQIYISPLDLNVEGGKIEQPLKPIIRFATPVFDRGGRKRGIIIFNYLGARLTRHLETISNNASGRIMLLNSDGYWLHGPKPEDEWGFMYEDRKDRTFKNDYPEEWGTISGAESGQFYSKRGFFTFVTVYPLIEVRKSVNKPFSSEDELHKERSYYWKIVSLVPPEAMYDGTRNYFNRILQLYAALVALLAVGSWYTASSGLRRKQAEEAVVRKAAELGLSNADLGRLNERLQFEIAVRKSAEEAVAKMNEVLEKRAMELEEANRELEAFSYSVAHDLRSPLRSIDGFVHILAEDYFEKLDEDGKRLLASVRSNVGKMAQLIDDLLKLSRIGRYEIKLQDIDMSELANSVIQELKAFAPERRIEFNVKTLPPAMAERTLIRQVFVNLISNAIKFTRPSEFAAIEVGGERKGNENIYYVRDNGIGFDPRYLNKIFGVFQRLHNGAEFEGTGVGLAIVQRIIHRHGGRVWAQGRVNEGATFYFTIPGEDTGNGAKHEK